MDKKSDTLGWWRQHPWNILKRLRQLGSDPFLNILKPSTMRIPNVSITLDIPIVSPGYIQGYIFGY